MFRHLRVVALLCLGFFPGSARAIVVMGVDGEATQNFTTVTPAPYGLDAYLGFMNNGIMATPISPTYLLTVTHAGNNATGYSYYNNPSNSTVYPIYQVATQGDLALWQIVPGSGLTFPSYAPVYTNPNPITVNQHLITIGDGDGPIAGPTGQVIGQYGLQGWYQSNQGGVSWGTNRVAAIVPPSSTDVNTYLYFTFNNNPHNPNNANEAIYQNGDSGGPTFVFDPATNTWELAGVNSAVDAVYDSTGTRIYAALFDARGFYTYNAQGDLVEITGDSPVPMGSYAVDIQSDIDWLISEGVPLGVPEPSSLVLTGLVAVGFALRYWRRSASKTGSFFGRSA